MEDNYRNFYTEKYESGEYGGSANAGDKPFYPKLMSFIAKYKIDDKARCLEIGSGKGAFQDIVNNYTGVDYSESVEKYYHKPFISASATNLPFEDESFDYLWSIAVWEHIPEPEVALEEAMRVLKPGGYFY